MLWILDTYYSVPAFEYGFATIPVLLFMMSRPITPDVFIAPFGFLSLSCLDAVDHVPLLADRELHSMMNTVEWIFSISI